MNALLFSNMFIVEVLVKTKKTFNCEGQARPSALGQTLNAGRQ